MLDLGASLDGFRYVAVRKINCGKFNVWIRRAHQSNRRFQAAAMKRVQRTAHLDPVEDAEEIARIGFENDVEIFCEALFDHWDLADAAGNPVPSSYAPTLFLQHDGGKELFLFLQAEALANEKWKLINQPGYAETRRDLDEQELEEQAEQHGDDDDGSPEALGKKSRRSKRTSVS